MDRGPDHSCPYGTELVKMSKKSILYSVFYMLMRAFIMNRVHFRSVLYGFPLMWLGIIDLEELKISSCLDLLGVVIRIGPDRAYPLHFTHPQLLLLPVLLLPVMMEDQIGGEQK